jgi:putative (di)nucleoside polyphosphate hydrolase
MTQLPLRPNVCMLVLNSHRRLFLGERLGEPGVWQFPQGGVETSATLEENVLRELEEELGAARQLFSIVRRLKANHQYEFSRPPQYAVDKWRGQMQSFWLVSFLGKDEDIKLDNDKPGAEPEFSAWRWCTLAEVRAQAEPKRLLGYEKALAEVAGEVNP